MGWDKKLDVILRIAGQLEILSRKCGVFRFRNFNPEILKFLQTSGKNVLDPKIFYPEIGDF